jgi:hypothetical protein
VLWVSPPEPCFGSQWDLGTSRPTSWWWEQSAACLLKNIPLEGPEGACFPQYKETKVLGGLSFIQGQTGRLCVTGPDLGELAYCLPASVQAPAPQGPAMAE